jgi:hypothetical protein
MNSKITATNSTRVVFTVCFILLFLIRTVAINPRTRTKKIMSTNKQVVENKFFKQLTFHGGQTHKIFNFCKKIRGRKLEGKQMKLGQFRNR